MPAPLSSNLPWELANNLWAQSLNTVMLNPLLQGKIITAISLLATTPLVINHGLGRTLVGWLLTDNTANAVVWRTSPINSQTITLEASATTTISLWVF